MQNLAVFLAIYYLYEAWRDFRRASLAVRLTQLQNAHHLSIVLLFVIALSGGMDVGMRLGATLQASAVFGAGAGLGIAFWALRFISQPQSNPWLRGLQSSIKKIAAFVVGGFFMMLVMSPFERTLTSEITCIMGALIFAIGPTMTTARNASRSA